MRGLTASSPAARAVQPRLAGVAGWQLRSRPGASRLAGMAKREKAGPVAEGLDFAKAVAQIADDNRAEDVVILDLRGLSSVADFFVIATGTSDRQLRAIADQIEEYGQRVGQARYGLSGYEVATWILVDYVDVVIHLFDADHRQYYDLELLWGDAPRVTWHRSASA